MNSNPNNNSKVLIIILSGVTYPEVVSGGSQKSQI